MPTSVTLPDGTEVEFPDSMSPGQIQEVMNRRFRKAPAAPTGPRPVDWNLPPVDYGTSKYKAADLLASGRPITEEQYLRGQGTVGSVAEMQELEKRKLAIYNQNVPQQQQLDLWRQHYATKGEDPVEYMADRVGFSPTGFVRAWNYRQAKQRFEAGQADYQDVAAIARMEREQQIESEKGIGRRALDIATAVPGYALETMATGGLAPVARGTTAAQKIFSVLTQAGKAGAKTALVTPRTYQEAQMRMANGENVVSAHAKALTGQTIDRATELMGGAIPLPKKLEAIGKALKGAWVRKTGLDPSKYNDALARVGVNGVLGELLEERFAEVARGVTVDEDFGTTGDLLTGEFEKAGKQLLAEILASGGIKGASNVMSMIDSAEKNKGKKPAPETLPRATDAYAPEPVGGDNPTSLQQYEQEQNRGKKRVETFGDVVDRQFDPPRVEKARNQDFRTLEPSAFFNEHQGTREAVAALPDSPTRGQFAKALGIPRDSIRSREPINAYIAEARKQQPAAPVQEPPQVSVPSPVEAQSLPAPVQEAAPAAAPVAPAKSEAWQRAYDQLPADMDGLVSMADFMKVKLPKKGTKARSKLTAEELRTQIANAMTTRKNGVEVKPDDKPAANPRPAVEAWHGVTTKEWEEQNKDLLESEEFKKSYAEFKVSIDKKTEEIRNRRRMETITDGAPFPDRVRPVRNEKWQKVHDQLPTDLDSLMELAKSHGMEPPKKAATKAAQAIEAENLRKKVADKILTRYVVVVEPEDITQPPVDVSEFEDAPYQSPKPFSAESGKGVWMPLAKKGKASKKRGPLSDKVWKALYDDTRGKGNQYHGASDKIEAIHDGYYSSDNIYGNGFYTTDSAKTAQSYQKKNKGKNPTTYKVREKTPVKMFNLDQPIDKKSSIVRWIKDASENYADPIADEGMIAITEGEAKTYAELLDYMRHGAPRDQFQEVMDSITYNLTQEGYGGFEHQGGRLTKDEPHTVKIYWEPENQIEIEEVRKEQLKKNRGKKQPATEEAFTLKRESDALWKGDRPLEDTREEKKQGTFISGLGKDTPATRLLIDTDFEGEVKEQKKAAPAGWGSIAADEEVVRKEAETKTSGAERIINNLRKSGRQAKLVEPSTDFHRDMGKLAREFGLDVAFFDSKARVAGITNANTVAFNVRSAEDNAQDYTWGIVGHEIAHGTGIDSLVDAFGKDLVDEWSKKYYDNVSPDIKKRLDENPDLRQREGVATLIENFMRDPRFRSRLKQNNVSAWGKVVDKVWDVFSGFTPDSKPMKTALEVLKRARSSEQYRENKIREIAADTVSKYAPGSNQEQMIEDFAKLIKEKHRDAVQMFKLREKAKSEAKVKLGLDARLAAKIENKGKDLSSVRNIDTVGRTLVNEYQDLFPGDAEQQDYERIAWDLVSEPRFDTPPDLSQDMIDEAWEQLTGGQDMRGDAWEPDEGQIKMWEDSGFDLFAEEPEKSVGIPTQLTNNDVQRAYGRANPATTLAGRMEIMKDDIARGRPVRVPRSVAESKAMERLQGDGAAKERAAFVKKFQDGDFSPLNDVDTIVLKSILDMSSVAKALESEETANNMALLNMGYRATGIEESRGFAARRDPIHRNPVVRNNRAIQDTLMPGLSPGELQAIVDALKKLGIDLMDKKLLEDDIQVARAIGEIRAQRRIYDSPAMERYADMVFEFWINSILSGTQTHMRNLVGNNASLLWHSLVERTAEVAVSKATRGKLSGDKQVRDFKELAGMYKSMAYSIPVAVSNAATRFRHEVSPLQIKTGGPEGIHDRITPRMAIPGKIGKFFRTPTRLLAASDEFTRTIGVYGAVSVNAYREARKLGLEGREIDEYVGASLSDPSSPVWQDSLREMAIVTFQQEGGAIGRKVKGVLRPIHNFPVVGRYLMTFDNFMVNAFGRFADLTPGFGLAVASINHYAGVYEADKAARDAKKKGMKPHPDDNYGKVNWNRVVGNQIVGLVGLMAIGMMMGDDEDSYFDISGTKERRGGKRDAQYRTLPPKMFRIGEHQFPYGGYEPFDSLIAASVDFWDDMKDGAGVTASSLSAFFGQIADKNYLQIIDDLGKIKESVDSQGAKGGMNGLKNMAAKTAVSFIPNAYRQTNRLVNNRVTSRSTWIRSDDTAGDVAEKMAIEAGFISSRYAQDHDIWGRPKSQSSPSTSLAWRLAVPGGYKSQKEVLPVDIALLRYNEANPDNEYWPTSPQVPKYDGKLVGFKDYSEFSKEAGEIAYGYVKDKKFSDPPTESEINYIRRALETGRKKAKANLMERLSRRNGK